MSMKLFAAAFALALTFGVALGTTLGVTDLAMENRCLERVLK